MLLYIMTKTHRHTDSRLWRVAWWWWSNDEGIGVYGGSFISYYSFYLSLPIITYQTYYRSLKFTCIGLRRYTINTSRYRRYPYQTEIYSIFTVFPSLGGVFWEWKRIKEWKNYKIIRCYYISSHCRHLWVLTQLICHNSCTLLTRYLAVWNITGHLNPLGVAWWVRNLP